MPLLAIGIGLFGCRPSPSIFVDRHSSWPFQQAPLDQLRATQKKVFAHYFPPFPISIENAPPERDYYSVNYLVPAGENGKFAGQGGYFRERPLTRPPRWEWNWADLDAQDEVRRAVALGLDGFTVDILAASGPLWDRILDAAHRIDPGFKIVLVPDMTQTFDVVKVVSTLARHPSVFRLDDGRVVVAPFLAEAQPASWWKSQLDALHGQGVEVAFLPMFLDWSSHAADFAPISAGFSVWGTRSPTASYQLVAAPDQARKYVPLWMAPAGSQDFRPKDFTFWEAANSASFLASWTAAIQGNADWVQICTWNDYSEGAEISPSTATQYGFYDLSAYFISWFKTGQPPPVTRDVLYYFHRIESTKATPDSTLQTQPFSLRVGSDPTRDEIELLAFLTAPGTLEIDVGGTSQTKDASGVSSFPGSVGSGHTLFPFASPGNAGPPGTEPLPHRLADHLPGSALPGGEHSSLTTRPAHREVAGHGLAGVSRCYPRNSLIDG